MRSNNNYDTSFLDELDNLFQPKTAKLISYSDLQIRTKKRQLEIFTPNDVQKLYLSENQKFAEFIGNREIILKARQMGFSTLIAARMFIDTVNVPNTQSIIVAQDEMNAKKIFQMIRRFYDNLPPSKKRKANTDSADTLHWKDIDSYFFVGWAGSKKLGRGGTVNNVHLSECAFYENMAPLVGGLLQSVPQDGNIFIESTANGVANYYYMEYQAAMRKESIYTDRFYPWFLDDEYSSNELVVGTEFIPTDEEEQLAEMFGLTDQQLIWRRNKTLELLNAHIAGNEEQGLFPQEYPITPYEAFLTTGAHYFNNEIITKELQPNAQPPLDLSRHNNWLPYAYPRLREVNGKGINYLKIWKKPIPGKQYIVSADPSEGLSGEGDKDFCSTHVVDFETWEVVAALHGRWEPNDYAGLLNELGRYYNLALIVPERNNHGHSVINSLLNQFHYPPQPKPYNTCSGLYYHVEYDAKDKKRAAKAAKPGYHSNVKSKALYLGALSQLITDGSMIIHDIEALEECKHFSKLPGGKFGCVIGHDDRVISLALLAIILTDTKFARKIANAQTKPKSRKIPTLTSNGGFM